MLNEMKTTIELSRIQLCDLMTACTCAYRASRAKKWEELKSFLDEAINDLDEKYDTSEIVSDLMEHSLD